MKSSNEANRLWKIIDAAPTECSVYVPARYATHFQSPPRDGRVYFVQDPRKPSVLHRTSGDGVYTRLDHEKIPGQRPLSMRVEVHVKGKPRPKRKGPLPTVGVCAVMAKEISEEALQICLIDIKQVMRICGFSRSFIHDRADFPKPYRLGNAQRSASRWVEAEIVAWVEQLIKTNKR